MQTFKKNKKRFQTQKFFRKGGVGSGSRFSRRITGRNPLYDGSIIDNRKSKKSRGKPVRVPAAQSPAGTPVQSPAGTPVQSSVGTPVQSPVGTPVQSPAGTPVQNPAGTPVQTPAGTSVQSPAGTPVQNKVGNSATERDQMMDIDIDGLENFANDYGDNNDYNENQESLGNSASASPAASPAARPAESSAASSDINFDELLEGFEENDVSLPSSFRTSASSDNNMAELAEIPFCNCSPLFTDKLIEHKVRKNSKLSDFFRDNRVQIQNRSSLQKQLRDLNNAERNAIQRELTKFCINPDDTTEISEIKKNFINDIMTDATDKNDILVIRTNNKIHGVMAVGKWEDTYIIDFLSFGDNEIMAGFMLMVYLLCLNENKVKRGVLLVTGGRENKTLLCLGDKYGFKENNSLTSNLDSEGGIIYMEVKLVDGNGKRVLKAKIVNTFLEKCRKFQRSERECGAKGYGQNRRTRSRRARRNAAENVVERNEEEGPGEDQEEDQEEGQEEGDEENVWV